MPNAAGMLSYASWFTIPPGKHSHLVQNNCCYRGWLPLTTFAMRVHTHTLGRSVTMTRVTRNGTGEARTSRHLQLCLEHRVGQPGLPESDTGQP